MDWTELTVYTNTKGVEIISGLLQDEGINGMIINDPEELQAFLENPDLPCDYIDESLWDLKAKESSVVAYVSQNRQGSETLEKIKKSLNFLRQKNPENPYGSLLLTERRVNDEDWENNWKVYFKPFAVGRRLYVKPSWEQMNPDCKGRKVIEIDPGSSFGTGQHHTTRLCMELMEDVIKPGDRVLDAGSGSGILSIAAFLLGADRVVGVDIDENAVRVARENCALNRMMPSAFKAYCGNMVSDSDFYRKILEEGPFDIILANIVADVLIAMRPHLTENMKPNGYLLCSGIIMERKEEFISAMRAGGLKMLEAREESGWIAVLFENENSLPPQNWIQENQNEEKIILQTKTL